MNNHQNNKDRFRQWVSGMVSRLRPVVMAVAAAAVVAGIVCGCFSIASGIEQTAVSRNILASAQPVEINRNVVVVMCTDDTIEHLAADTGWPIDRSYYTELLRGPLSAADTVVFDILFADSGDPLTDEEFAAAVSEHGGVVFARSETTLPIDPLLYSGARVGYAVEFEEDERDAVSRKYKLYFNSDRCTGPTLIGAVLLSQGYAVDFDGNDRYTVTSPDGESIYMNVDGEGYFYRIPAQHGTDIQMVDLYDVYTGNCDSALFENAVVFVGGTVAGFEDIVYAPDFAPGENYTGGSEAMRVVGTKYLADCYCTVLRGFSPVSASKAIEGTICGTVFLLAAILTLCISVRINWAVLLVVGLGWIGVVRFVFVSGWAVLPTVEPVLCCAAAYLMALVMRLIRTSRERTVSSLPLETLYHMAYELDDPERPVEFAEYVRSFESGVFSRLGAAVVEACAERPGILSDDALNKGRNGTVVVRGRAAAEFCGKRAVIIIPLPAFGDEETKYTVLGTARRTPAHWVQSITALVLAMYVYNKAQSQSLEKQRNAMAVMQMIIQMIDAKDPVTAGHSRRVSSYSRRIAEWLGYSRSKAADVEFAALLHDIGKIGVADTVLNKPGLFTEEDFEQMRSHPSLGADIVRTIGLSDDIVDGVLHHHERLDGGGYPDGTAGGEYARIIKVADVYDALTSQRQYKSAWNTRRALDVIYNGIGTEFDERIARTFIANTAPAGYDPERKREFRSADSGQVSKLLSFAREFWRKTGEPIRACRDTIPAMKNCFSFDCTRRFIGLEWGERFTSPCVLRDTPVILDYDEGTGSVISALSGKVDDQVSGAACYFHKGCLSAGLAVIPGNMVTKAESKLSRMYGRPENIEGCLLWRAAGHTVVKIHSDGESAFVLITNYLLNEI